MKSGQLLIIAGSVLVLIAFVWFRGNRGSPRHVVPAEDNRPERTPDADILTDRVVWSWTEPAVRMVIPPAGMLHAEIKILAVNSYFQFSSSSSCGAGKDKLIAVHYARD